MTRSLVTVLLVASACGGGACGYSTSSTHGQEALADGKLPTTAVEPFENNTFRRGLELRLSRLVADEIRARSPQSPEDESRSDWIVTGTITRATERLLSEDVDDSVRESSFWVTCDIVLRDRATDTIIGTHSITKNQSFSDRAGRFLTDAHAAEEVLREIAEATVYWLEAREHAAKPGHPDEDLPKKTISEQQTPK